MYLYNCIKQKYILLLIIDEDQKPCIIFVFRYHHHNFTSVRVGFSRSLISYLNISQGPTRMSIPSRENPTWWMKTTVMLIHVFNNSTVLYKCCVIWWTNIKAPRQYILMTCMMWNGTQFSVTFWNCYGLNVSSGFELLSPRNNANYLSNGENKAKRS